MAQRRFGFRTALAVATLVVTASSTSRSAVAQQTAARTLIRAASIAAPRAGPALDRWERRSRLVMVNDGVLPNSAALASQPAPTSELVIDLFDGTSITAVFDRFDPNDSGVTWVGHVPGHPGSLVTVVRSGGVMAASIVLSGASYVIRPVPSDVSDVASPGGAPHMLVEINGDGFEREAAPLIPESSPRLDVVAADTPMADTADVIDVLIVYTGLAETWAGGPAGIINWINLGVSETNSAYAASGVNQRVRLAHTERVAYTEVSNFVTNLNNLRAGAPGLESIGLLRNAYSADLVSMFVRAPNASACGIAFLMTTVSTAFAPNGFSVVDAPCSTNGVLAHEFGHNMGLRHDWYMDAGVTPFTYAHGHVNVVARFRTVMAYPDACASQGISCPRLLAFSNPNLTHLGQPMGVAGGTSTACPTGNALNMSCDADESRVLNMTASAVANFREFSTLRPPVIQSQPQSQSASRGQAVTLQVAAEGAGPFTYQWFRGTAPATAQPIAGATGAAYTFVPGTDGIWLERAFYWVMVSSTVGPSNSQTATITMVLPGAASGVPQRQRAEPQAARARGSAAAGSTAQPRSWGATLASVANVAVAIPPSAEAPANLPRSPEMVDASVTCHAAATDAGLALEVFSRRGRDAMSAVVALWQLMRALIAIADPACQRAGGSRP